VTEEGWKLFEERLAKAKAALEAAWKLDPTDAKVAAQMVTVCMGRGHPREQMEVWFRRAMEADGDCVEACPAKLGYLLPKWHGSEEEVLAFARACVRTGNYEADLPMMLVEAHTELAAHTEDPGKYLSDPVVWKDIRGVMEEYLKRYPTSKCLRTDYANVATKCLQFREAHRQYQALGADYWRTYFADEAEARQTINRVKREAQQAERKRR
jgi:hypothetical protein